MRDQNTHRHSEVCWLEPALEGGGPHHARPPGAGTQFGQVPDGRRRSPLGGSQLLGVEQHDEGFWGTSECFGDDGHDVSKFPVGLLDDVSIRWR